MQTASCAIVQPVMEMKGTRKYKYDDDDDVMCNKNSRYNDM